jgi:hypothetical protein
MNKKQERLANARVIRAILQLTEDDDLDKRIQTIMECDELKNTTDPKLHGEMEKMSRAVDAYYLAVGKFVDFVVKYAEPEDDGEPVSWR